MLPYILGQSSVLLASLYIYTLYTTQGTTQLVPRSKRERRSAAQSCYKPATKLTIYPKQDTLQILSQLDKSKPASASWGTLNLGGTTLCLNNMTMDVEMGMDVDKEVERGLFGGTGHVQNSTGVQLGQTWPQTQVQTQGVVNPVARNAKGRQIQRQMKDFAPRPVTHPSYSSFTSPSFTSPSLAGKKRRRPHQHPHPNRNNFSKAGEEPNPSPDSRPRPRKAFIQTGTFPDGREGYRAWKDKVDRDMNPAQNGVQSEAETAARDENAGAHLPVTMRPVTVTPSQETSPPYNSIIWVRTTTTATTTTSNGSPRASASNANAIFPPTKDGQNGAHGQPDYIFHHSVARELGACLEPAMVALHRYDVERERKRERRARARTVRQNGNTNMNGDQGRGVDVGIATDVDVDMDADVAPGRGTGLGIYQPGQSGVYNSDSNMNAHANGINSHQHNDNDDADLSSDTEIDSQGNPAERVIYVSPSGMPFTQNMLARYRRGILLEAEAEAEAETDGETFVEFGSDDDGEWTEDWRSEDEYANGSGSGSGRVFFEPAFIEEPFGALARARMSGSSSE